MRLTDKEIERLFRSHYTALNAAACRKTRNEEAEDIVQDAFLRLLEMADTAHIANVEFYLFRIASNIAIDQLRKQKAHANIFTDEIDDSLDVGVANGEPVEEPAILEGIRAQILRLPKRKRDVFLLSQIQQFNQPEIATKLGVSLRTVSRDLNETRRIMQLAYLQQRSNGSIVARV